MDDNVKLLEKYYDSFISVTDAYSFFIGFSDYISYINTELEFDKITAELSEKAKPLKDKMDELSKIAIAKLDEVYKEMRTYSNKNKVVIPEVFDLLEDYERWKAGKISGSNPLANHLHDVLGSILQLLYAKQEYKIFAANYIEFYTSPKHEDGSLIVKRWLPLKEMDNFYEIKDEWDNGFNNELWGQIGHLALVYETIKHGRIKHKKLQEEIAKNPKKTHLIIWDTVLVTRQASHEWQAIQDGTITQRPWYFLVSKIKPIVTRLHNYLLQMHVRQGSSKGNALLMVGKMKTNPTSKIPVVKFVNDFMVYENIKIPFKRGQKAMAILLFNNAKIYHNGTLTKKGNEIDVPTLQQTGGYKTDGAFRNALKKMREKLKPNFPASIENPQTKKYQMVLKYNRTSRL